MDTKMIVFLKELIFRIVLPGALMFSLAHCAMAVTKPRQLVTVTVEKIKQQCSLPNSQCLLLKIDNQSPEKIEFGIDVKNKHVSIAEPLYSYQGLKKGDLVWNDIALSLGDYIAPTEFVVIPSRSQRNVEVYFPGELPTSWLYTRFRIALWSRSRTKRAYGWQCKSASSITSFNNTSYSYLTA